MSSSQRANIILITDTVVCLPILRNCFAIYHPLCSHDE